MIKAFIIPTCRLRSGRTRARITLDQTRRAELRFPSARPAVTLIHITENKRLKSKSQNDFLTQSIILMFTCVEFARMTGNCCTKLETKHREGNMDAAAGSQSGNTFTCILPERHQRATKILPVLQKSEEPMTSDLCSFWVILNKSSSLEILVTPGFRRQQPRP